MKLLKNSIKTIALMTSLSVFSMTSQYDGTFFFNYEPTQEIIDNLDSGFIQPRLDTDISEAEESLNKCFDSINKYRKKFLPLIHVEEELDIFCPSSGVYQNANFLPDDREIEKNDGATLSPKQLQSLNIDRLYIVSTNECYSMETRAKACSKIKRVLTSRSAKTKILKSDSDRAQLRKVLSNELLKNDGTRTIGQ